MSTIQDDFRLQYWSDLEAHSGSGLITMKLWQLIQFFNNHPDLMNCRLDHFIRQTCEGGKIHYDEENMKIIHFLIAEAIARDYDKGIFVKCWNGIRNGKRCHGLIIDNIYVRWRIIRELMLFDGDYKCSECSLQSRNGYGLHTHHIKSLKQLGYYDDHFSNLKVLCERCHILAHGKVPASKPSSLDDFKGDES